MKRFLTLGIRVVLCLAAGVASTAKDKIVSAPPHCLELDRFYKPCPPSKYGGYDCKVHISIKPLPGCVEFDHQRILQVSK
jgi:hypothetical protein